MSKISVKPTDANGYRAALAKLSTPKHFLNAPFYGRWQELAGKKVVYFAITKSQETIGAGLAIALELPGKYYYFYCPYGPLVADWSAEAARAVTDFFKNYGDPKLLFARLDSSNLPGKYFSLATEYTASTSALQPRVEWLLDIGPEPEELLASMHKKARYHIGLSERSGAKSRVEASSKKHLEEFYRLMETTARRDNFSLLPKSDYAAALEAAGENAFVAYADIDGRPVAAAFCVNYDGVAHYVYGCSSDEYRKIGVGYYLQWHCILHAKSLAQKSYNFGGISGGAKGEHLAGITQFKQRFGGYAVAHELPADIIVSRIGYRLFTLYKYFQKAR